MRVTSGSWDGEKVILRDQVLEVRPRRRPAAVARGVAQAGRVGPADRALRTYGSMVKSSARNQGGSAGPLACRAVR